jgi:hypothetical protein
LAWLASNSSANDSVIDENLVDIQAGASTLDEHARRTRSNRPTRCRLARDCALP